MSDIVKISVPDPLSTTHSRSRSSASYCLHLPKKDILSPAISIRVRSEFNAIANGKTIYSWGNTQFPGNHAGRHVI
jgi:hypothetical protein